MNLVLVHAKSKNTTIKALRAIKKNDLGKRPDFTLYEDLQSLRDFVGLACEGKISLLLKSI